MRARLLHHLVVNSPRPLYGVERVSFTRDGNANGLNGIWKYTTLLKGGRLFIIDSAKNVYRLTTVQTWSTQSRLIFSLSRALSTSLCLRFREYSDADQICRNASRCTADINYVRVNSSCSESTDRIPHTYYDIGADWLAGAHYIYIYVYPHPSSPLLYRSLVGRNRWNRCRSIINGHLWI